MRTARARRQPSRSTGRGWPRNWTRCAREASAISPAATSRRSRDRAAMARIRAVLSRTARGEAGMAQVIVEVNGTALHDAVQRRRGRASHRARAACSTRRSPASAQAVGNVGDIRLLVMAGLVVADRLVGGAAVEDAGRAEAAHNPRASAIRASQPSACASTEDKAGAAARCRGAPARAAGARHAADAARRKHCSPWLGVARPTLLQQAGCPVRAETISLGPMSILTWELSLALALVFVHTAPTYASRYPGSYSPTAMAARRSTFAAIGKSVDAGLAI